MSGVFDYSPRFTFTADASNNITGISMLQVGDSIQVYTAGVLPAPLAINTNYYVLANSKLSATIGGAIINITSVGAGTHTFASTTQRPLVGVENFPAYIITAGRGEIGVSSYKEPPPANKLESGYVYDARTGTLDTDSGEFAG